MQSLYRLYSVYILTGGQDVEQRPQQSSQGSTSSPYVLIGPIDSRPSGWPPTTSITTYSRATTIHTPGHFNPCSPSGSCHDLHSLDSSVRARLSTHTLPQLTLKDSSPHAALCTERQCFTLRSSSH